MWRPACNGAAQGMGYRKPIGKLEQHGSDGYEVQDHVIRIRNRPSCARDQRLRQSVE
jgi:hypothetical protein